MENIESTIQPTDSQEVSETENNKTRLNVAQTRVLACLVEKQLTVPDQYPLSLNALMNACNQKSSRDPQMNLSLSQTHDAVKSLEKEVWTVRESSVRTDRFFHKLDKKLEIDKAELVALVVMMLRGPQTFGEIRIHSGRMFDYEELSYVELVVESLIEKGLVEKSERVAGMREVRYQQTLSPVPKIEKAARTLDLPSENAALEEQVEKLNNRVETLEKFIKTKFDDYDVNPESE